MCSGYTSHSVPRIWNIPALTGGRDMYRWCVCGGRGGGGGGGEGLQTSNIHVPVAVCLVGCRHA